MKYIFPLVLLTLLILISYQDFKYRAVSWILFPVLTGLFVLDHFTYRTFTLSRFAFFFNLTFIMLQLVLLTVYFSVKNKKYVKIWEAHLGLGDILFFVILSLILTPFNFLLFYISSLVMALAFVFISSKNTATPLTIPLAGIQSALLALLIGVDVLVDFPDHYFANLFR
jgi:hypothetical protein